MNKYSFSAVLLLFIFVFSTAANAQSKTYKVGKRKCERVEIADPGEFYSTYDFETTDIDIITAAGLKEEHIALVQQYHKESNWPTELGNFNVRINEQEKIKSYVVYKIATIGDKVLLVAPAKYNQQLGEGWAPTQDIYFVVGQAGVKILES